LKSEEYNEGERVSLVTVKDAAKMFGVSDRTIWRMIADGQLVAVRIRGCTRLLLGQVLDYLKGNGRVGGV
jgi:excisionase family DNA binding protein